MEDRAHFFAVSARMMRGTWWITRAGRRGEKGTGRYPPATRRCATIPVAEPSDLLALDGALERLPAFDARKCQVVKSFLRRSPGQAIAAALKTTEATVRRDWKIARAWLFRYLEGHATL